MIENEQILIIAAHPDDEILGCGGTIVKLSKKNKITALILGEGIMSRNSIINKNAILKLRKDARKAQEIIGINNLYFEEFPDNSFDSIPFLKITKKTEDYIKKINPDIIFTHHHSDLNIDHRITFQAVLTSCRPQPDFKHPDIYCFEIPSSTDYQILTGENIFKPNVFIDITETIDIKLEALKCYKSEIRQFPHSRSIDGIKLMAQDWGRKVGKEYIEAFELIRSIRNTL